MPKFRLLTPAITVLAALAALMLGLQIGGGAAPLSLADPGPVVRWGLPVARVLQDISLAATVGGLVLACFALVPGKDAWNRALDVAAASSAVATVTSGVVAFLMFRTVVTENLSVEQHFTGAFIMFFTEIEAGQLLLATTVSLAVLTTGLLVARGPVGVAWLTVAFAIPLACMSAAGHSGGTENHTIATTGLWLHLVFACIWLGGLLHLGILRWRDQPAFAAAVARYSSLALVSFLVVAFSGVVSALVRMQLSDLMTTPYGQLVVAKTVLLFALGGFGAWQRRKLIPAAQEGRTRALFTVELAVMGVTMGVAAALARTETPIPQVPAGDTASPARILTGSPLPPEFAPIRLLTEWKLDPLWAVVCAMLAFFYVAGVIRLRRRGDHWPVLRTVFWLLGTALLFWTTNGSLNLYQEYFFSWHMLTHMLLGMAVPVLLAPGAPVTLAMRAIRKRDDGSRGGREWLLAIVHSKYMAFITQPLMAAGIFVLSLWAFYYTPVFGWVMANHVGHIWMVVHFVGAGYLFVQMLLGIDPQPHKPAYPLRVLLLLITMAGHAFFGLAIMSSEVLMLPKWFGAMGNGIDALQDQRFGGGIAWSVGEIPTLVLTLIIVTLWVRSDRREQRRIDRKADRDGNADLQAYNDMLERMQK